MNRNQRRRYKLLINKLADMRIAAGDNLIREALGVAQSDKFADMLVKAGALLEGHDISGGAGLRTIGMVLYDVATRAAELKTGYKLDPAELEELKQKFLRQQH